MSDKDAAQAIIDDTPPLDIIKDDLRALAVTVKLALKEHHKKFQRDSKIAEWQKEIDRLQDLIDNAS